MSDEQALLAAIRNNPEEDTPRLMYADWLDEHATSEAQRAHAEFIRVQIELARLPELAERHLAQRRNRLSQREQLLLALYQEEWLHGPVPDSFLRRNVTFRRGFASEGELLFEEINSPAAATALLQQPVLRTLSISGFDAYTLPEFLALPLLKELRGLSLQPESGDWSRLANCHRLGNLQFLCLWGNAVLTQEGATRVAHNSSLAGVHSLQLLVPADTDPLPPLLSGTAFQSLRSLYLRAHETTKPSIPSIFHLKSLQGLKKLNLHGYNLDGETIDSLTSSMFWPELCELELNESDLRAGGLTALAAATGKLKRLSLIRCRQVDLSDLCGPLLRSVQSLHLDDSFEVYARIVWLLAESGDMSELRALSLCNSNLINDRVAEYIATSPQFGHLYRLDLTNTEITSRGAMAIANSPHLENLASMYLSGCQLDESAKDALRERFGDSVWIG